MLPVVIPGIAVLILFSWSQFGRNLRAMLVPPGDGRLRRAFSGSGKWVLIVADQRIDAVLDDPEQEPLYRG